MLSELSIKTDMLLWHLSKTGQDTITENILNCNMIKKFTDVGAHTHTHTHTHMHACMHMHTHTNIHGHTHTHTHVHACTHTHTHSLTTTLHRPCSHQQIHLPQTPRSKSSANQCYTTSCLAPWFPCSLYAINTHVLHHDFHAHSMLLTHTTQSVPTKIQLQSP